MQLSPGSNWASQAASASCQPPYRRVDPQFAATRQRLDGVENGPAEHWWHDVVLDVRKYEAVAPSGSKEVLKKQTAKSAKPKGKKEARRR